jgi:uncharacterized protein (DUF1330 family)
LLFSKAHVSFVCKAGCKGQGAGIRDPSRSWPSSVLGLAHGKRTMAKAYWISAYRSIRDEAAVAAYAKLAAPALQGAGGRFLARGLPKQLYESGIHQRTVLIEFDSVAQAIAAHDGPAYQEALRVLGNGADRDLRIIEGVA